MKPCGGVQSHKFIIIGPFNCVLVIQFSNLILSPLFMFKLNVCDGAHSQLKGERDRHTE